MKYTIYSFYDNKIPSTSVVKPDNFLINLSYVLKLSSFILESKKFYITKKPGNPNRFLTVPAAPELFDLYAIPAVFP